MPWLPKRAPELNPMDTLCGQGKDVISANKQYAAMNEQVGLFASYLGGLSNKGIADFRGVARALLVASYVVKTLLTICLKLISQTGGLGLLFDFCRHETASCSDRVVFNDFGTAQDLPALKSMPIGMEYACVSYLKICIATSDCFLYVEKC